MPEIGNTGVAFDTIAREWRCKYTGPAGESASLKAANDLLNSKLAQLKAIGDVKRVVCGGCLDFKACVNTQPAVNRAPPHSTLPQPQPHSNGVGVPPWPPHPTP